MRDRTLAMNTALLTASGLVLRFAGMVWQVWLVSRIGEAGIGLFQLVMSVAALAGAVAVSGSRFTSTRLVSEELGLHRPDGAARAMTVCLLYGLFFGMLSGTALMLAAEPAGFLWLGDARTVRPLTLLALEMPLTGIDSVMHGYFTAVGRVWKSVLLSIGQQAVTIAAAALLLRGMAPGDLEYACFAIAAGRLIGAGLEAAAMGIVFVRDRRRHGIAASRGGTFPARMTGRVLRTALPLALATYARSGLSTLQHLLVPVGLRASGLAAEDALAGYGVIQGMALPAVLFPSCVMLAVAELIVPKLTEQQVRREEPDVRDTSERVLRYGSAFALLCASILFFWGGTLGRTVYGSPDAGTYIRLFALIVPVMYLDMLTDGCLKGLGEMMFCMYVNIADSGLSALMVWLLLPHWGLTAYIATICFTEIFNFALSFRRLQRISGFRLRQMRLPQTVLWAALCGGLGRLLHSEISAGNGVPALILSVAGASALYAWGILSPSWGAREEETEEAGRRASG